MYTNSLITIPMIILRFGRHDIVLLVIFTFGVYEEPTMI